MSSFEGLTLGGLDLNNGTTYLLTELEVPPAKKKPQWVAGGDSDGALLAEEAHYDNRVVTATVIILPTATEDLALAAIGAITDKLQEASRGGIDAVWTPADSTKSGTLNVLMGEVDELPITVENGWFAKSPEVKISLTCKPFLRGQELTTIADTFATNTIANYTLDAGTGTIIISGGVLVPSSTAEKRLIHTASPYDLGDTWTTVKITTGASVASGSAGVLAKRLDASNYLRGRVAFAGSSTQLMIDKVDAGSLTSLQSSSTFTASTATSYWLRLRIEGNITTIEFFTSAPTATSTPTQTTTHTLTGGDATKYGSRVVGRNGLWMTPQATDWRMDDLTIEPNAVKSDLPVVALEIADVLGDVPADTTILITDSASQPRRHIRIGLEAERYDPATSLLIDSASLVTTGMAGATATRSGAYSGGSNNVITATLRTDDQAICSTGALTHVGTFRVFARLYLTSSAIVTSMRWSVGDGYPRTQYPQGIASVSGGFVDVDYGVVTIEPTELGSQKWTAVIAAHSIEVGGDTFEVDALWLVPAQEGYASLRQEYRFQAGLVGDFDEFRLTTPGTALNGTGSDGGGTWATAGATTDFVHSVDPGLGIYTGDEETTSRSTTSQGTYRTAVLGSVNYSNMDVSCFMQRSSDLTGAACKQALIARWVDASNHLKVVLTNTVEPGVTQVTVVKTIAGVETQIAFPTITGTVAGIWYVLRTVIFASGVGHVWVLSLQGAIIGYTQFYDATLLTGGTLDDGKPGIADQGTGATANSRYYDNFYVSTPPAEIVPVASGRALRFGAASALSQDSTGTYWGRVAPIGSRFRLRPDGGVGRKNRIAVMARRHDISIIADSFIADLTTVQVSLTPLYLNAPR